MIANIILFIFWLIALALLFAVWPLGRVLFFDSLLHPRTESTITVDDEGYITVEHEASIKGQPVST